MQSFWHLLFSLSFCRKSRANLWLKTALLFDYFAVFLQYSTQGEILLFNWGPIQIYQEGLINAAFIFKVHISSYVRFAPLTTIS